jgi:hypothetical protein
MVVVMDLVPPLLMEVDPDPDPNPRHTELVSVNRQDTAVTCEIEIGIVMAHLADRTGQEEEEEGVLMVSTEVLRLLCMSLCGDDEGEAPFRMRR